VSFYSKTNQTWDKCGFWMHSFVALVVYVLLPGGIIALVMNNASEINDTSYAAPLFTLCMVQL